MRGLPAEDSALPNWPRAGGPGGRRVGSWFSLATKCPLIWPPPLQAAWPAGAVKHIDGAETGGGVCTPILLNFRNEEDLLHIMPPPRLFWGTCRPHESSTRHSPAGSFFCDQAVAAAAGGLCPGPFPSSLPGRAPTPSTSISISARRRNAQKQCQKLGAGGRDRQRCWGRQWGGQKLNCPPPSPFHLSEVEGGLQ